MFGNYATGSTQTEINKEYKRGNVDAIFKNQDYEDILQKCQKSITERALSTSNQIRKINPIFKQIDEFNTTLIENFDIDDEEVKKDFIESIHQTIRNKLNEVIKKYTSDPLNPALKKMDKHNTELLQKLGVIDEKEKKDLIKRIYSNIRNELNEIRYSNTNQVTFKLENMENAIKKAIEDPEIYNQNSQIIKNYSRYCWGVVFNVVDEIESSNLDEKNNKRNNLGIYMTEKITNYYLNQ